MANQPNNNRAPNPPLGYSRDCDLSEAKQIRLVAEFHANRIRPSRIAYRLGIDIALIDALLAGEYQASFFTEQLAAAQSVVGICGCALQSDCVVKPLMRLG